MLPYNEVKFLVNVDLVQGNLTSSIIMLAKVKRFLSTKDTKWGVQVDSTCGENCCAFSRFSGTLWIGVRAKRLRGEVH
jgi:hypothetical protein